jgi:hypothetical protein
MRRKTQNWHSWVQQCHHNIPELNSTGFNYVMVINAKWRVKLLQNIINQTLLWMFHLETTLRPKSTRQLAYTTQHVSNQNQSVNKTLVKEETSFNQKQK